MKKIIESGTVTVDNYTRGKWVDTGPGSRFWKRDKLPDTTHRVQIEIDVDAIIKKLGYKAVKNKGKISREMDGLIIVREIK